MIKNKILDVVYIEYFDCVPHSVIAAYQYNGRWIPSKWDFFKDAGNNMELSRNNSGSGGDVSIIECPHFVNTKKWKIWYDAKKISFKNTHKVKVLKRPIVLENGVSKSRNPFSVSWEVFEELYCKECDGYHSQPCFKHMFEDEDNEYNLTYNTDNQLVE